MPEWCGHMLPKVMSNCSLKLKIQLFGKFLTCLGTSKIFIFIKKFNRNLFINSGLNHILQHLNINFHLVLENVDNHVLYSLVEYEHHIPMNRKSIKSGLRLNTLLKSFSCVINPLCFSCFFIVLFGKGYSPPPSLLFQNYVNSQEWFVLSASMSTLSINLCF